MSTKPASKPKRKPAVSKTKAKVAVPKKRARSLQDVVGPEVYRAWVQMLRVLVPDGRTHRLAPLVAAMLQYADALAGEEQDDDPDENSVVESLRQSAEVSDPSEIDDRLGDVVARLFKDAGVEYQRTNSRGRSYSIAKDAYQEYLHWYDMPWEWGDR